MDKLKAVIFDLDGTLLNTLDDLTDAVDHALGALGRGKLPIDTVRRFVGNGVPKLISRALFYSDSGDVSRAERGDEHAEFSAAYKLFTEYYDVHSADKTRLYPGIEQMLADVKRRGLKTAVVTNKYDGAAQALKKKFLPDIDFIVGTGGGVRPKPMPDGVEKALAALGADRREAVYVGDGETDIQTAKNSGLPVVAVTWGFRDRKVLEALSPDYIINSPDELVSLFIA